MPGINPENAGMQRVESDAEVLCSAINDAINIYVREVLIPRGLIKKDEYQCAVGLDELQKKIVSDAARKWAVSWIDPQA